MAGEMPLPPFYVEDEIFNVQPIFATKDEVTGGFLAVTFRNYETMDSEPAIPINTLGKVVSVMSAEPTIPETPRDWKIKVTFSNGIETTLPPSILRKAKQVVSEKLSY